MGSDDASDPAGDAQASPAMSMAQLAVAGGVSGLVARFATHPFDTLKTQMQVAGAVGGGDVPSSSRGGPASTSAASAPARYRGALETARALVRKEGPLGFYRGFGAVVAGIPFASAAYFGGYEAAKRATDATRERVASFSGDAWTSRAASALTGPTGSYVLSGIIAQSLASIAYTPIDVVKERMQAGGVLGARAAGQYDNFVAAYRAILKTEGIRGVFRGYWASNFTWWPFSVVYFVVYEHARDACAALARDARSPRDGAAEVGGHGLRVDLEHLQSQGGVHGGGLGDEAGKVSVLDAIHEGLNPGRIQKRTGFPSWYFVKTSSLPALPATTRMLPFSSMDTFLLL